MRWRGIGGPAFQDRTYILVTVNVLDLPKDLLYFEILDNASPQGLKG
jgi:hypothetical protein